jgi:hypothetical protein
LLASPASKPQESESKNTDEDENKAASKPDEGPKGMEVAVLKKKAARRKGRDWVAAQHGKKKKPNFHSGIRNQAELDKQYSMFEIEDQERA